MYDGWKLVFWVCVCIPRLDSKNNQRPKFLSNRNAEPVIKNSWYQAVYGLNWLLPKEIRNRLISEEARQTGFKTSYVPPLGFQDSGLDALELSKSEP